MPLLRFLLPNVLCLLTFFSGGVAAATIGSSCGPIPATYGMYAGGKLDLKKGITINGSPVVDGKQEPDAGVDINGNRVTASQTLPPLDPATFPPNSSTRERNETHAPFVSSSAVYYKEIDIDKDQTVSFSGGGPFHIDKLDVHDNSVVNLAAGTYFINELKMHKDTQLVVTSEPVILHIGDKFDMDDDVDLNKGGSVTGLRVFMHDDSEFKGDKRLEFDGILYGTNTKKVEIKEGSVIHGPVITGDDLKVEKDVIWTYSSADQAAVANIGTCPTIHHFAISHDGGGINCQAEPVTFSAHLYNEAVDLAYTGTVTIGTATSRGDWSIVSGNGSLINSGNGAATYAFAATDNGQVILGLRDSFVETTNVNVNDGSIVELAGEDPNLTFAEAGFEFDAINTQIAGKGSNEAPGAQALEIRAIRSSDQTGACEAALTGAVGVELASECRDPVSCAGQLVQINGTPINANNRASVVNYSSVTLDFGDMTDFSAPVVLNYPDAGQIRLHARYELLLDSGAGSGNLMTGASNEFVVRPFGFDIDFSDDRELNFPGDVSIASDVNGSIFGVAGIPFDTTVTAVVWQLADDADRNGVPDSGANLGNNFSTPNFGNEISSEAVDIDHSLYDPPSGSAGSLSGGAGLVGFSSGALTTQLRWDEVGIINLDATLVDGSYLGSGVDVTGSAPQVGRFTPDHFDVTLAAAGGSGVPEFGTACGSFTYLDQPFDYAAGQAAQATIVAREAGGGLTLNYGDYTGSGGSNWWRLADLSENYSDAGPQAPDDSAAGHSPATDTPTANGQVQTTFNGPLTYARPAAGDLAPFDADIRLEFAVRDADGIAYDDGAGGNTFSSTVGFDSGAGQRHGRLRAMSASGSELMPLKMPVTAEYYSGSLYTLNTDDSCTALDLVTQLTLSNNQTAGGTGQAGNTSMNIGAGNTAASFLTPFFTAGNAGLRFSAPGNGNTGYVDLNLSIGALTGPYWLQYNWSGAAAGHTENPPRVRATFGIYGTSPRIIQIREPWN